MLQGAWRRPGKTKAIAKQRPICSPLAASKTVKERRVLPPAAWLCRGWPSCVHQWFTSGRFRTSCAWKHHGHAPLSHGRRMLWPSLHAAIAAMSTARRPGEGPWNRGPAALSASTTSTAQRPSLLIVHGCGCLKPRSRWCPSTCAQFRATAALAEPTNAEREHRAVRAVPASGPSAMLRKERRSFMVSRPQNAPVGSGSAWMGCSDGASKSAPGGTRAATVAWYGVRGSTAVGGSRARRL